MKKVFFIVVVLGFLLIINGLLHSIYDLWQKKDVITQAQKTLDDEKSKNQKLKGELSYVKTPEFIENESRNKLFLVKPGEQGVIIPKKQTAEKKDSVDSNKPNWQKWLSLFK